MNYCWKGNIEEKILIGVGVIFSTMGKIRLPSLTDLPKKSMYSMLSLAKWIKHGQNTKYPHEKLQKP